MSLTLQRRMCYSKILLMKEDCSMKIANSNVTAMSALSTRITFYYCFKTNCYMNQSNRLSLIPLITIDYHCALISIPATCLHRFKNVKDTFSNFVRGGLLCWMVSGVWYLLFGIWYLVFRFGIWYLVFRFGIWYLDLAFGI